MKKILICVGIGASILLFTGCANPSFNPNYKKVIFVEGKSFRIPHNSSATPHRYVASSIDNEKINIYNKFGMNCKYGDILWIENYTAKEAKKVYETNGKIAGYNYVGQASRQSKSGCSKSLSNQEYSFYRGKEMEASANARTKAASDASYANYMAATTPKTVNVQHSGYVNQNVNVSGSMNHNVNHTYNPYTRY